MGRHLLQYGMFAAFAAYVSVIEPRRLAVRRIDVPIPGLPQALDGLRIGHLSDLHRGPLIPHTRLERAITLMAADAPDLVAVTGDFVSYWPGYAAEYREILAPLRPRLGIFACTGNHEHWTNVTLVTTALQAAGVTVLRNRHCIVTSAGAQLCLVGVDDIGFKGLSGHRADPADDLPAALADSPLSGVIRVLLVHNPDFVMGSVFASETAQRPIHLVLSGHTHGGQVRLPLIGAPRTQSRYGQLFCGGLVRTAGTQVHVSRGAGSSWPLRFNCRPEVNVLTLRTA